MSIKSVLKLCALLFAISLSQNSFAGPYWGIGVGNTNWTLKPLFGTFELKDGTTLDLLLGVRTGNFAYEGEFTFSSHDWVGVSGATHHAGNVILAGLGYLPINQTFEFYGKLGLDFWKTTVDFAGATYDGDTGMSLVLGLGANINITPTFNLRAEYKRMNDIGDGVDTGDIGQGTLIAVFKF